MPGIRRATALALLSVAAGGCEDAFLVGVPADPHRRWWGGFASQGLSNQAYALVEHDGAMYAGGRFLRAGDTTVNGVARWDGSTWRPLANGVRRHDCTSEVCTATVQALASWNGSLVAAGRFTVAGGAPSLSVARWDGMRWHALGAGLNGDVHALAVYRGALVAAGDFVTSGDGTPIPYLATWVDGAWVPLGGGTGGTVYALAVIGGDLIAGGAFETAGAVAARRLARWDGSGWAAMAQTGEVGEVRGLMTAGDVLIAAGRITVLEDGGWYSAAIARWDGDSWSRLGYTVGDAHAVCQYRGSLVAAVRVSLMRSALYRLEGERWAPVSSVVDGEIRALQPHAGHLYLVGTFTEAGNRRSPFIARWDDE
jgi:hypothetical protein